MTNVVEELALVARATRCIRREAEAAIVRARQQGAPPLHLGALVEIDTYAVEIDAALQRLGLAAAHVADMLVLQDAGATRTEPTP